MAVTVPSYPYVHVGGEFDDRLRRSAWAFRTYLTKRRGTKKTEMSKIITALEGDPSLAWARVPFGYEFERERILRVWLQVEGDDTQKAPEDAVLYSELPLDLWVKAGVADGGTGQLLLPYLLVPERYWLWSAGALSFEKVIMTVLQDTIRERILNHKDTEVREELVWIGPVGEDDLMYYFIVLTQIGIRPRINLEKGNPSFFDGVPSVPSVVGIQQMPDTHLIWEWLLRIEAEGITQRGSFPDGRNGQALLDTLFRDPIVNFLRDLADVYQKEDFEEEIKDGGFDRGEVHKAVSNGFGRHKPNRGKALREHWLKRADEVEKPRIARATLAGRIYGFGAATSAILKGFGEGWAADLQVEADRLVALALNCTRHNYLAEASRIEGLNKPSAGSDLAELAEKGYIKGELLLEDAREIDKGHELNFPSDAEEEKLYKEWLRDMGDQLNYILSPQFPH